MMSCTEDGILRVYDLSSFKVLKAVRGLGAEVSSIICVKRPGSELRDAWLACGKRVRTSMLLLMTSLILDLGYEIPDGHAQGNSSGGRCNFNFGVGRI
jgi:hypothetical protein